MSTEVIEQKLTELQQRLETLEAREALSAKGQWRELIGWEKNDEGFR